VRCASVTSDHGAEPPRLTVNKCNDTTISSYLNPSGRSFCCTNSSIGSTTFPRQETPSAKQETSIIGRADDLVILPGQREWEWSHRGTSLAFVELNSVLNPYPSDRNLKFENARAVTRKSATQENPLPCKPTSSYLSPWPYPQSVHPISRAGVIECAAPPFPHLATPVLGLDADVASKSQASGLFFLPVQIISTPFFSACTVGLRWFALPRLLAAPFQEVQMLTPFRLDSITSFLSWCSVYDMLPDDDMIKTKEGRKENRMRRRLSLTTRPLSSCPRQPTLLRQPVLSTQDAASFHRRPGASS